ncbi:hypothetical protein PPERSA_06291 [Pseudocohnilembus persalinus]|uniref:Uncharacterized protein n=1 Tax=Pseudocohnilembus persalinus TaxID=266149 RepID=A0A0V0QWD0_PSEPJ|nr:hypothetical protein PPERSA_06291 [Pseudocohnilembus persalinus]|eukprot:KRX06320.1 hypothetical protein PPERSA_06291 [Pseudocohnilembus persalinus]
MIRKLCESCGKDNHDFSICKAIHIIFDPYRVIRQQLGQVQQRKEFLKRKNNKIHIINQSRVKKNKEAVKQIRIKQQLYLSGQLWFQKIEEELNQSDLDEYEQQEIFTQSSQYDLINDSQDSSMIELNQEESQILDIFSKDTIKEVNSSCSNFNNLGVQQEDSVVISQKSQKTKKSKKSQRSKYSNQIKKSQIIQNQRKNTNDDKFNLHSPFSGRSEHKNTLQIGDFNQVSSSQFNIQKKPYIKINNQNQNQVQQNCSISLCKESLSESNESSPKIKTGKNRYRNKLNEDWNLQTENQLNIKQDFQFCDKDQQFFEQNVAQKQVAKKVSKLADQSQYQQQIQKINNRFSETKNKNKSKISNLKILIDENNFEFNSENNTNTQKDDNIIYNYNNKNDGNNNCNAIDINGNGSTKNTSINGQYQKQVSQNQKKCTNNNTNVFNQQKNRELKAKKTFFMNSRSREPSKLNSPQISYNNSKQTLNLKRETPKNSNFKILAFPQIGKFVNTNNQLKIQENEQQTFKMGQSNCKMIQSKKQNPLQGWMNKYIQQQQQKQQQQSSENQIQQQNYYNNEMLLQNQHYFYSDNYQNFINFQNDFFGVDDIDQMKIMRLYFTRYNYNQVISQYMNLKLTKNVRKRASITIQKNKFFKMNGGIGNCNQDATNLVGNIIVQIMALNIFLYN